MIQVTRATTFTHLQREIFRAITLHGGIDAPMAERFGFTKGGVPCEEMQVLVNDLKIIAPRVLTSMPLRVVWQFRDKATHNETLAKIARQASRLNQREYAKGGFQLTLRPELLKR